MSCTFLQEPPVEDFCKLTSCRCKLTIPSVAFLLNQEKFFSERLLAEGDDSQPACSGLACAEEKAPVLSREPAVRLCVPFCPAVVITSSFREDLRTCVFSVASFWKPSGDRDSFPEILPKSLEHFLGKTVNVISFPKKM